MGDLIIQPNAGAGNKLIIKDQASNELFSTDDSGGINMTLNEVETTTTGKVKQKGAFCQSSMIQSWIMGR